MVNGPRIKADEAASTLAPDGWINKASMASAPKIGCQSLARWISLVWIGIQRGVRPIGAKIWKVADEVRQKFDVLHLKLEPTDKPKLARAMKSDLSDRGQGIPSAIPSAALATVKSIAVRACISESCVHMALTRELQSCERRANANLQRSSAGLPSRSAINLALVSPSSSTRIAASSSVSTKPRSTGGL
jgi:hypothetical protein